MPYLLLERFRSVFEGVKYIHRDSSIGDSIAVYLVEDMYALHRSDRLDARIAAGQRVQNTQNRRRGINARRGDGTFGELIPGVEPVWVDGYQIARGPIATVEVGAEVKILCKAMIRQIDRVMGDMEHQVDHFRAGGGQPISIGIVGINQADHCTTYEGDVAWPTTGQGRHRHPFQEAQEVENRIIARVRPRYDELLILRFRATNEPPYPFEWVDGPATKLDYAAILTRMLRRYEQRFG